MYLLNEKESKSIIISIVIVFLLLYLVLWKRLNEYKLNVI